MGNDMQTKLRWDQDVLEDCSPKDCVWGWSVCALEVLHYNKDKLEDECLLKMLHQGLLDKQAGAPAWCENSEVKHGVGFVSSMIVRVLQRCFKMEEKVQLP